MKNKILLGYLLVVSHLLVGCAPWVRVDQALVESPGGAFSVQLPIGWMLHNSGGLLQFDEILATRDGLGIQYIEATKTYHSMAFRSIEKSSSANMLPTDLSELEITELKTRTDMANLEVVSRKPARVAGRDAFRLHVRAKNKKGLAVDRVIYGFVVEDGFYRIVFQAPRLHYFGRDLPAFEKSIKSMRLLS